jgi:hypothetical protein
VAEIRVGDFSSGFVLYFQTPEPRINAYALASTLVSLADAAKAAGRTLDSTTDIEIVVEALTSGSFKVRVSAVAHQSGLFIKQSILGSILLSVLGSYIYDHTLGKRDPIQVQVNGEEVVITHGDDRIIVSKAVHQATQLVSANPAFVQSVGRMLNNVAIDERVTGFGLARDVNDPPPEVILPRELLTNEDEHLDSGAKTRVIEEDADLYIIKAIMERSKRKWEFQWHGIAIAAPIKDPNFYDDFALHSFTIAPGDEFQARLAIHQKKDDISGVYANTSYEVLQVYRHVSHLKPGRFAFGASQ